MTKELKYFEAKIFLGAEAIGEPETEFSGAAQTWQDFRTIRLPGFDGSQTLNLDGFWLKVFNHQATDIAKLIEIAEITEELTGVETITKYSNTQQLKQRFTIVASLSYETK